MQMKRIIEERTALEKKFKAKYQELEEIKQRISDINNTDLFNMTFEKYANKPLLQEYYNKQHTELTNYINASRHDNAKGPLGQQITSYIREKADNSDNVVQAFKAFEDSPSNKDLEETYTKAFNAKVDELHNEVLEWLADYFEVVDDMTERSLKATLKKLPKAISIVDIETKKESEIKGIPYAYSRRQSRR